MNFLKIDDLMKAKGNYKCHIYIGKIKETNGPFGGGNAYIKRVIYTNL